jgi:hypothetical protein
MLGYTHFRRLRQRRLCIIQDISIILEEIVTADLVQYLTVCL